MSGKELCEPGYASYLPGGDVGNELLIASPDAGTVQFCNVLYGPVGVGDEEGLKAAGPSGPRCKYPVTGRGCRDFGQALSELPGAVAHDACRVLVSIILPESAESKVE